MFDLKSLRVDDYHVKIVFWHIFILHHHQLISLDIDKVNLVMELFLNNIIAKIDFQYGLFLKENMNC